VRSFAIGLASLLAVWILLSAILGSRVVPPPQEVFLVLLRLFPTVLYKHLGASFLRVLGALGLSVATAVPLGLAMGRNSLVDRALSPIAYLLYPVPKVALLPILLILLGAGDLTRVVLVALVLFFQMLLAVRDGVRRIDNRYLLSIDSLGAGAWDRLRYVIWPAVLPRLLTALRIGSGTALAVLFFAETFFTRYGLGFFIVDSWMKLAYPEMLAGIVMIAFLFLFLFFVIDRLEERFTRWQGE
jgi:ABC-type nitrate/sulfonate/bicarbonate transport system permease component